MKNIPDIWCPFQITTLSAWARLKLRRLEIIPAPALVLCLFALLLPALSANAAEIINVIQFQADRNIVVEYDLVSDVPVMVNVNISVLGVTYTQNQLSLEGDVGKLVLPGKTRRFTWDAQRDFPAWRGGDFTLYSQEQQHR